MMVIGMGPVKPMARIPTGKVTNMVSSNEGTTLHVTSTVSGKTELKSLFVIISSFDNIKFQISGFQYVPQFSFFKKTLTLNGLIFLNNYTSIHV